MATAKPFALLPVMVIGLIAAGPATHPAGHAPATAPAAPDFEDVLTRLADDRTAIKTAGAGKSLELSDDQQKKWTAEMHVGAVAERQVEKKHAAEKPAIVAHAKRGSEIVNAAQGNADPAAGP